LLMDSAVRAIVDTERGATFFCIRFWKLPE
jgi:hypothetical protein